MLSWTLGDPEAQKNRELWNGTKKSLKKEKLLKENFIPIRDTRSWLEILRKKIGIYLFMC